MRRFEFLPHTADVRLFVEADSTPELFAGALEGMAEFLLPKAANAAGRDSDKVERRVDIISVDESALLVEFLSEALFHSSTSHAVFRDIVFDEISETRLGARIAGERVEGFADDIKAVTYRGADIHRGADGKLSVTILFDI